MDASHLEARRAEEAGSMSEAAPLSPTASDVPKWRCEYPLVSQRGLS